MNLPQGIDSKFRLILLAARRTRQLQGGAKPLLQTSSKKPTRIALQEVESGLIPFEFQEVQINGGTGDGKSKSKSPR